MAISVRIEGNHAIIDDGNVRIDKDGYGKYNVKALDFHTVTTSNREPQPKTATEPYFDPHVYAGYSSNGLTLEASVSKAMRQVATILGNYDIGYGNRTKVQDVVKRMIVANKGRDKVYSLAARIAKDMSNGVYKGVPFHVLFDALESGEMTFPEPKKYTVNPNARYSDIIRNTPPYTGYSPFFNG